MWDYSYESEIESHYCGNTYERSSNLQIAFKVKMEKGVLIIYITAEKLTKRVSIPRTDSVQGLLIYWIIVFAMITALGSSYGADNTDDLSKLSVSLAKPSETLDTANEWMGKTLAKIKPKGDQRPTSFATTHWGYVLYGNLFNTHEDYALMEVPQIVSPGYNYADYYVHFIALARWTNGKWKLSGLWDIDPVWRPKGWEPPVSTDNTVPADSLTIEDPAEHPFALENYSGPFPAIVIAGEALKYCQVFYLFQFDPKSKSLIPVGLGTKNPTYVDGYISLYDNPTSHGTWVGTLFFKSQGAKFVEKASWYYHSSNTENSDEDYIEAGVPNEHGNLVTYRLQEVGSRTEGVVIYKITQNDKQVAEVSFTLHLPSELDYFGDNVEEKYLFEKLTGLPASFYPIEPESGRLDLSGIRNVTVKGDRSIVKLLSFKHSLFW